MTDVPLRVKVLSFVIKPKPCVDVVPLIFKVSVTCAGLLLVLLVGLQVVETPRRIADPFVKPVNVVEKTVWLYI